MKGFFKTFLAVLLAMITLPLLFIWALGSLFSSLEPAPVEVKPHSVLVINLDENIADSPHMPTFVAGASSSFEMINTLTMLDVIEALESAAGDPNIAAIYLNFTGAGSIAGTTHIEELRSLLAEFRQTSGKPIVAYNETYSQGTYWLSSVADKVYMNPAGGLDWRGLASQSLFFKGAIDKLGVDVQIVRHGTYKSAVEPYMLKEMSPANRHQTEAMVESLWRAIVDDVAISRNLSPVYLQLHASTLAIDSPKAAQELGYIDGLKYQDEVMDELAHLVGVEEVSCVTLGEYSATIHSTKISPNKVAIIYADGEIVDGKGGEGIVGGATTADQIRRAREDKGVKAVVLRVNSPGGSALASEVMWRELKLLGELKPIVVSMANYAASGGYYISSPADHILAGRTTLTGSIGVFGLIVSGEDVLEDKLGITVDVAKTAPHADMGTMFRPLSTTEMGYMQRSVEDVYTTFVGHVAEGREMTPEAVNAIGEGRVWCGVDAAKIGLVDSFGGLKNAIVLAAEKAELGDDWRVSEILEEDDELTAMLKTLMSAKAPKLQGEAAAASKSAERLLNTLKEGSTIQARMPYDITIY